MTGPYDVHGLGDAEGTGEGPAPGAEETGAEATGAEEAPGGVAGAVAGAGTPNNDGAPADGGSDWNPTGLDLARSVVGSLVNRVGPASRRDGPGGAGGPPGGRSAGRGSGSRSRGSGGRGQPAYADIAGGSGAHPDDRDPQALDNTIGRLVADRGWNTDVAVAGALSRWDQIVGPQIAAHCRAERYAGGVLTVRADSTAWATQVRLLAATLVKRLNEDLGDGTVIRIVVQGPSGHDWRKGGVGTRDARGPRDTFG